MGSVYRRTTCGEAKKAGHKHIEKCYAPTWWIKYYRGGRPFRESAKTTDDRKARKLLRYREAQVETGTFPGLRVERIKFDELAEDFLNDYRINDRKSLGDAEILVEHLKGHFGGVRVMDITTPRISDYILKRQTEEYANATINRHLSALKRMLNLGARQTPPKVLRVPHIALLNENNARTGFFDHDEFLSLRGALPDFLKPVVTIAYYTGFRRQEILTLRWDQVDMERGRIVLEAGTTKNNEGRVVYMTADLLRVLSAWKRIRDMRFHNFPLVCFRVEGGKAVSVGDFRRVWARALEKIGLEGRILHDFRRTAVRNMVRAGIPERVTMRISGHKTLSMFDRYNITSEADIMDAAGKLDAFHKPKDGHNTGTIENFEDQAVLADNSQLAGTSRKNFD